MPVVVELLREDEPGEKVVLTEGNHILGRGPLLKCNDKRVSRKHCELDVKSDGKVFVRSTHVNSCYVKPQNEETATCIHRNKENIINDGDQIRLLEDSFWFNVLIIEPEKSKTPEKKNKEMQNGIHKDIKLQNGVDKDFQCNKDEMNHFVPEKKRKLPSWVLKNVKNATSNKEVANRKSDEKGKGVGKGKRSSNLSVNETNKPSVDVTPPKKAKGTEGETKFQSPASNTKNACHYMSDDDYDDISEQSEMKKNHKEVEKNSQIPKHSKKLKQAENHEVSDESESESKISLKQDNSPRKHSSDSGNKVKFPVIITKDDYSNESDNDSEKLPASQNEDKNGKRKRLKCQYKDKCYRKNPSHRSEFSHPDDADYGVSTDNDSDSPDDPRPECEFGKHCFRKNPIHKKEFKHTHIPQPRRKAKNVNRRQINQDNEDDDENEYDLNDSFLNDESSEDFRPTDDSDTDFSADEEDSENLRRALKESKKFINNPKMYK